MMLEIPSLDDRRCSGTAACVEICPTSCLEMTAGLPWLPRPGDCVSCSLCVVVCPTHAIAMIEVARE